ncbi:cytochrome c [Hymenobacter tibetensis]|uniref:Cytochrome c n=1 Tax=Hymenobacter tibetensis TaxID=497967 RepID=A0ABY4CWA1_9BACT|nr:cytochrome c [Hymenobacter tibetensis]UOG74541.1 cytochrome c [Hymenobacter tibetensis]
MFTLLIRLHAVVVLLALLFFGYKLLLLLTNQTEVLRNLRARTRWTDSTLLAAGLLTGVAALLTFPASVAAGTWFVVLYLTAFLLFFVRALRRESKGLAAFYLLGFVVLYGLQAHGAVFTQPLQPNTLQQALLGEAPNAAALKAPVTPLGRPETTPTPDAVPPVDTLPDDSPGLSEAEAAALEAASASAALASPPADPEGEALLADGKVLYTENCAVCHGADGRLGLNGAHDLSKSNLNTTGRVYMVTQGLGKMPSFKDKLTASQIQQVVAYSISLK